MHTTKSAWLQTLSSMDHEDDDPGTDLERGRAQARQADRMSPRQAWRAIQAGLPRMRSSRPTSATTARSATPIRPSRRAANIWRRACSGRAATASRRSSAPRSATPTRRCVGFAGDGAFGISMNEMTSIGRKEWPGDHHGGVPQLPVGRREAQLDPLVRRQLRRHRARSAT